MHLCYLKKNYICPIFWILLCNVFPLILVAKEVICNRISDRLITTINDTSVRIVDERSREDDCLTTTWKQRTQANVRISVPSAWLRSSIRNISKNTNSFTPEKSHTSARYEFHVNRWKEKTSHFYFNVLVEVASFETNNLLVFCFHLSLVKSFPKHMWKPLTMQLRFVNFTSTFLLTSQSRFLTIEMLEFHAWIIFYISSLMNWD